MDRKEKKGKKKRKGACKVTGEQEQKRGVGEKRQPDENKYERERERKEWQTIRGRVGLTDRREGEEGGRSGDQTRLGDHLTRDEKRR